MSLKTIFAFISAAAIVTISCAPAQQAAPAPAAAPTPQTRAQAAPTTTPVSVAPVAESPQRGGRLTIYITDLGRTLDATQEASSMTQQVLAPLYSRLVTLDPEQLPSKRVVIGDLADSWESNRDATQLKFRLRPGLKFHDGQPVTSADVVATFRRILDAPGGIMPAFRSSLGRVVDAVTAPDASNVIITTKQPAVWLLEALAKPPASIVPAHVVSRDQRSLERGPIGTGPFRFKSRDENVRVELQRSDTYWNQPYPYLDSLERVLIKEAATQFAALRTGRVQMTGMGSRGLSASEVTQLKKEMPSAKVFEYTSASIAFIWLNNRETYPFKDVRVRQALARLINQREIIDLAMEGAGFRSDFTGSAESAWAMSKSELERMPAFRAPKALDIDEAKRLMKEAGFANGFKASWVLADIQSYKDRYNVIADQARRIGIDITVGQTLPYSSAYLPTMRQGKFDISESAIPVPQYDPTFIFDPWIVGGLDNRTGFKDDQIEQMYKEQGVTLDPAKRKVIVDQIQRRLWEIVPSIPAGIPAYFVAARPEVRGLTHPGVLMDNFLVDRVWLKRN
ncbi:MAG: ABC transporter substrate-binding protein [Chloroflexi bacterium]|nr:ABC transporter substrate-binding protein [Chloroflexota bacterium]